MALVKHHEKIGEKILANLDLPYADAEFESILRELDLKYGSRLEKIRERAIARKKNFSAAETVSMLIGLLFDRQAKALHDLDQCRKDLEQVRRELGRVLTDRVIYQKIGKNSFVCKEIIRNHALEVDGLRRQVTALKRRISNPKD